MKNYENRDDYLKQALKAFYELSDRMGDDHREAEIDRIIAMCEQNIEILHGNQAFAVFYTTLKGKMERLKSN